MGCQEFAHARGEYKASEIGIDIDPQPAAHGHGGARRLDGGILDAGEVRLDLLVEASPFLGERDGTRRAVEQTDANAPLEPCDRAAHAGLCEAERLRRPHEAPGLDHRGENLDPIQQSAIERQEPDSQSSFL
jgi:hypothetical protein